MHTRLALALLAVAPALAASPARAADTDADVAKLNAAGQAMRWNDVPAGKSERYGHAEALVHAPLSAVRSHITNFAQYKSLVPQKFNNARVIAREGGSTDVYFQVPVLHGMVTLWKVLRFAPIRVVRPGEEVLEGTFVRGNVKDAHLYFTIRRVDDNVTLLRMSLLILPNVPAPQAALDEELRDAAGDAVNALHDRAQGHARTVQYVAPPPGGAP
jgi:hypothetical protein